MGRRRLGTVVQKFCGPSAVKHLDLFSGIGGFALAARRVGWMTTAFCEIDSFCQKVLAKHWPGVPIYDDVRKLDGRTIGVVGSADILTAGFPCQDLSNAGRRAGIDGDRSGLWSHVPRILSELQPRVAVLENVTALLSGDFGKWFQRVLGDLAEVGYDCEWHCIPASVVGAHHQRDRVWIVAHSQRSGLQGRQIVTAERLSESRKKQLAGFLQPGVGRSLPGSGDCGNVDGIPDRAHRNKAIGNAIVPQVAEVIFRSIQQAEKE